MLSELDHRHDGALRWFYGGQPPLEHPDPAPGPEPGPALPPSPSPPPRDPAPDRVREPDSTRHPPVREPGHPASPHLASRGLCIVCSALGVGTGLRHDPLDAYQRA